MTDINPEQFSNLKKERAMVKVRGSKEFRSLDEVREALTNLSDADLIKMRNAARGLRLLNPGSFEDEGWSEDDLIGMAAEKALIGERNWREDMGFVPFLIGAMRSIVSNLRKKRKNDPIGNQNSDSEQKRLVKLPGSNLSQEQELELKEADSPEGQRKRVTQEIENLFKEDGNVLWILQGLSEGLSAKEIQQISGMNEKTYETSRKRMRRKIIEKYPNGWNYDT